MTYRQWVMLQQALLQFREACERYRAGMEIEDNTVCWDSSDGEVPSEEEEVDALAQIVGDMSYECE